MLSATELSNLRGHADDVLEQTCTINEATLTSDAMGSFTIRWASTFTDIPCRLARLGERQRIALEGERITYHDLYRLHIAYDQVLEPGDRVEVGDDTFDVLGIDDAHQWSLLKTALLSWVEGLEAGQGVITDVEMGDTLPASPSEGDMYYLTSDDYLYVAVEE